MKHIFILCIFTIASLINSPKLTAQSNSKFTVVLDPGHGGHDNGTRTKSNIKEKDINLYVAKFIKLNIEEFSSNIKVVMTRENDTFIPLKKRPLYARILNADLFISIHCNHNPNSKSEGLEIYIQSTGVNNKINVSKIKRFANILNKVSRKKLNYKSRGIKYENFSVLRNSINYIPSTLIELGFFSNKNEADYITSQKGINGLSLIISKSIIEYLKKKQPK